MFSGMRKHKEVNFRETINKCVFHDFKLKLQSQMKGLLFRLGGKTEKHGNQLKAERKGRDGRMH